MKIEAGGFDWDEGNRKKCGKHGVSLLEIEEIFRGDVVRVAPSLRESAEDRFVAIGRTSEGRALFVAFTYRPKLGRTAVRPISARYMHLKEIAAYEEESSKT